jgi:hypothetical protein
MKKKKLLVIISYFVMLLSSGCAAGIVGQIPPVNDDFATVYIARKGGGWVGCGSAILIQLDDKDFIRLGCGMKTNFKIQAGVKVKVSQVSSMSPDHIFLEPVKGDIYYFGADCNGWVCYFEEMSKIDYRRIEATCDKELKIDQGTTK